MTSTATSTDRHTVTATGVGFSNLDIVEILGETFAHKNGAYYTLCWKCGGYSTIVSPLDEGRCWTCRTYGYTHVFASYDRALAAAKSRRRTRERQQREVQAKMAAAAERWEAERPIWREKNADLVAFCQAPYGVELPQYFAEMARRVNDGDHLGVDDTRELRRHVRQQQRAAERAAASRWFGTEEKRCPKTQVTVTRILPIDDYRSYREGATKPMVIMTTTDGAELKWITSWGSLPEELKEGETVTITARVEHHEISKREGYEGVKQTKVSRVKVV